MKIIKNMDEDKKQEYPMIEELTFKCMIKSESQGYDLLKSVQILVNEVRPDTIIELMTTVQKKPYLLNKAKTLIPYIKLL